MKNYEGMGEGVVWQNHIGWISISVGRDTMMWEGEGVDRRTMSYGPATELVD